MTTLSLKRLFITVAFSFVAMNAFAEDAPVYDVDNFPPQFDGQPETSLLQAAAKDQAASEQAYAPQLTLDQRVARLEQQINNMLHTDISSKVNDTQTEVQSLRGQLDELNHQLQVMQNQQKAMYADLDKRISHSSSSATALAANADSSSTDSVTDEGVVKKDTVPTKLAPKASLKSKMKAKLAAAQSISSKEPTKAVASETAAEGSDGKVAKTEAVKVEKAEKTQKVSAAIVKNNSQPNVAEEQQIYQTAYNLIKTKKYNEAASTLEKMLQKYPSGQFASNAHYWLGELYGLMGKNDQAVSEFSVILKDYPTSPKLADAQLKLGLIYAAQLKWPDAKLAFKKVINHYPGTSWARLASEQLKQLKQAGHG